MYPDPDTGGKNNPDPGGSGSTIHVINNKVYYSMICNPGDIVKAYNSGAKRTAGDYAKCGNSFVSLGHLAIWIHI